MASVDIYSIPHHAPVEQLATLLKATDIPATELSAVGWDDRETFVDELSTFFPFPRYFNREWESVKDCVVELVSKGRLILLRGLSEAAHQNLGILVDYAASAPEGRTPGTFPQRTITCTCGAKNSIPFSAIFAIYLFLTLRFPNFSWSKLMFSFLQINPHSLFLPNFIHNISWSYYFCVGELCGEWIERTGEDLQR